MVNMSNGCTGEFPLFVPRMQKKGKKGELATPEVKKGELATPEVKPEPPPLPISSQSHHIDCGDDFAMLVPKVTDLATYSHVGFACACNYVAKITSSRFPREKNRPSTRQSARVDDGISSPVQKIPPRSTSEPPPPLPNHTFLLIDPPDALSTWHKPEGACEDTRKSSNWPEILIVAARSPHEFTLMFDNASVDALMSLLFPNPAFYFIQAISNSALTNFCIVRATASTAPPKPKAQPPRQPRRRIP
jgi:hypothetical protein